MNPALKSSERIRLVVRAFSRCENSIKAILVDLVGNYTSPRATAAKGQIESLVRVLQRMAAGFCQREIGAVYEMGRKKAVSAIQKGYIVHDVDHASRDANNQDRVFRYFFNAAESAKATAEKIIKAIELAGITIQAANIPARVQATVQESGPDVADAGWDWGDIVSEIITTTLNEHESVGFARKLLRDALKGKLDDMQFVRIEMADGGYRDYKLGYYAEMVARTELARAMIEGTKAAMEEFGEDLVIWDIHQDPCPECAEYMGKIFSISGTDPNYEQFPDIPRHVNCECSCSPISQFDARAKGAA